MFILFIIGLLIGAITIVFALQNIVPITVTFLVWQFDGSLALILVLAALAGAVVGALLTVPGTISTYFKFENLKRRNRELENELEEHKRKSQEDIVRVSEAALKNNDKTVYVDNTRTVKRV